MNKKQTFDEILKEEFIVHKVIKFETFMDLMLDKEINIHKNFYLKHKIIIQPQLISTKTIYYGLLKNENLLMQKHKKWETIKSKLRFIGLMKLKVKKLFKD